jgi:hypothetical protein
MRMKLKSCSRCKQFKPLTSYDHSRASRDDRHHRCIPCDRRRDIERLANGSLAASCERWQRRHPEAVLAHKLVMQALANGKLVRESCVVCGLAKTHAHHEDYSKPLEVVWLCQKHHKEHHRLERHYGRGQTLFGFFTEGWL